MKPWLLLLTTALAASAQNLTFDAATIKANRSIGGVSSIHVSKGRVSMTNVSLKKLVLNAYGIPDDRDYLIDGPAWLATERFDIEATFPGDTPVPEVRKMMQTLLADRFKLAQHKEVRQAPIYSLVVAKNGPKIQPVQDGASRTSGGPGRLEATKISMEKLADLLAKAMCMRIVDATGLKGVFDFTLEWTPDQKTGPPTDGDVTTAVTGPSIFTALQEQLGLRLQGGKGAVEVLIVDHIEKAPTEN